MVFIRPTFEDAELRQRNAGIAVMAHGMLVAHSNSSFRWRYTNWWISHKYCSSSQVSPNGGVTSSIRDSEKSVVMCSLVSGAPRAAGMARLRDDAAGRYPQRLLLDALASAAQHAAFAGIDEACEAPLEFFVNHVTQYVDP